MLSLRSAIDSDAMSNIILKAIDIKQNCMTNI